MELYAYKPEDRYVYDGMLDRFAGVCTVDDIDKKIKIVASNIKQFEGFIETNRQDLEQLEAWKVALNRKG